MHSKSDAKLFKSRLFFEYIPILIVFTALVFFGIKYKQVPLKMAPVLISLAVVLLNSRANRMGFFLGGLNCVLYAAGFFTESLYGSAVSSLFSCVISFFSFFMWRRRAFGKATYFKKLTTKQHILLYLCVAAAWIITSLALKRIGGAEFALDGAILMLGIVVPVLMAFAYLEALPLLILSSAINCALWVVIIFSNSANITYLISGIYGLYMNIRLALRWMKLYNVQKGNEVD